MKWFSNLIKSLRHEPTIDLKTVKGKFGNFVSILENNNQILKIISDMEEKAQGDYLFDVNYIRGGVAQISSGIDDMIGSMIDLGGESYTELKNQKSRLDSQVCGFLPVAGCPDKDDFIISLNSISRADAGRVGGKIAQLGEIRTSLGLPVPDGFAISAWAYAHFIKANNLQAWIDRKIESLQIKSMADLLRISDEISSIISLSPIPADLREQIAESGKRLEKCGAVGFALRSSAIGEDSSFSFAGQYASYLNVPVSKLIEQYHRILADKFTPQAIYYTLSHSLLEQELAMGVGCIAMVDARASGVVYTRDPIDPERDCLLIHAIFGLGKLLVDGAVEPDIIRLRRSDLSIRERKISPKLIRLTLYGDDGVREDAVPVDERLSPSISEGEVKKLAEYSLRIEEHFGCPQDIEWAIDRDGRLFILQSRPLRVIEKKKQFEDDSFSAAALILDGGITICPGAGAGPVVHAMSLSDLAGVPEGAVLVTPGPFHGIVTVMDRVSAIITRMGNVASHMATLAREYRVPAIGGLDKALSLESGMVVTVDAGQGKIYEGRLQQLLAARRRGDDTLSGAAVIDSLKQVLSRVAPLNLPHPADKDFVPEKCRTYHDLIRYIHQKALEEMFYGAARLDCRDQVCYKLKTDIPLQIDIIYIDQSSQDPQGKLEISEDELASEPMREFWSGLKSEGWPDALATVNSENPPGIFSTSMAHAGGPGFSEKSYAVLGREYMMLGFRMGYHYSTIEAFCSDTPSKNYIRMQYKDGGASYDRRLRRIKIIMDLLSRMGFEQSSQGDFLDARIAYQDRLAMKHKLGILGRIALKTKQLDMVLSNDAIAKWYTLEFIKLLGLNKTSEVMSSD